MGETKQLEGVMAKSLLSMLGCRGEDDVLGPSPGRGEISMSHVESGEDIGATASRQSTNIVKDF